MVNAHGQSREYSIGSDWVRSHPICCHVARSLPTRSTIQYCVCFLLNDFAVFIIIWRYHTVQFTRANTGSYCKLVSLLSEKWKECWVCPKDVSKNFAKQPRHCSVTSAEAWRLEESDHSTRSQTLDPNGQGQSFHLGCSSARRDDPPISEVVTSEHCKQVSSCCLSV